MEVQKINLQRNGQIPNSPKHPLIICTNVFREDIENQFKKSFHDNGWSGIWANGVYDYHHYHSNAFEVLGVANGEATLILGGPRAKELNVKAGDMLILPPGTGHCRKSASSGFKVVGAYPAGQESYDICTEDDDVEEKMTNIRKVPLPKNAPVGGIPFV